MRSLGTVRQGWDAFEAEETRLLRKLTVQDSLNEWLRLQEILEDTLLETAGLFADERRAALSSLQARLRRLAA